MRMIKVTSKGINALKRTIPPGGRYVQTGRKISPWVWEVPVEEDVYQALIQKVPALQQDDPEAVSDVLVELVEFYLANQERR